jgi:hypothetical protein
VPSLADIIDFGNTYVRCSGGRKWTMKNREWIRDQFLLPSNGWKLWRKTDSEQCKECSPLIGRIVESPFDNATTKCECGGLTAEPIIVTVANLERQDGKTTTSEVLALADIFRENDQSVAALWASEDQGTQIFDEVYRPTIEASEILTASCQIFGQPPQIYVPTTRSRFEVLAASDKSATGRTRTRILIDEARDVHKKVAMKLIPAVFNMSGIKCPNGHVRLFGDEVADAPEKCTACLVRLEPWYGRIVITTSSGVVNGGDFDWCSELIDELRAHPHPNYHLFASEQTLNPSKSQVIMGAISDVFGKLESTRSYVEAEVGNRWTKNGTDYVTKSELKRVVDPKIINTTEASPDPCVAFLDTSLSGDKTSLVILASEPGLPWEKLYEAHLAYWIPAEQPNRIIDEQVIYSHLCATIPLFPALRALRIDTRGSTWSVQFLRRIKTEKSLWSSRVAQWQDKGYANTDAGWALLQGRILKATIRLQNDKHQTKEFGAVYVKQGGHNGPRVDDRDYKSCHRDITEALACCCYLAHQEQTRKSVGFGGSAVKRTAAELLKMTSAGSGRAGGQNFGGPNSY